MTQSRQPAAYWNDPAYMRALVEALRFQHAAVFRQWETLLASPVLPTIQPINTAQPILERISEPQKS